MEKRRVLEETRLCVSVISFRGTFEKYTLLQAENAAVPEGLCSPESSASRRAVILGQGVGACIGTCSYQSSQSHRLRIICFSGHICMCPREHIHLCWQVAQL